MIFDVIIGNPPYQGISGNKGSNNTIWDKFVELSLNLIKEQGFLCFIHPSGWRNYNSQFSVGSLREKQFVYLEMHDEKDGKKFFDANTRYDWYILRNTPITDATNVKDQNGIVQKIMLKGMPFIPNSMIAEIASLFAKDGEPKVKVLKDCAYHTHNHNHSSIKISKEKTAINIYPVVNSVNRANTPTFRWASFNDKGHFGIPKVIFGSGATGFFVDKNGDYGQTEFARSIVDEPKNLENIALALNSEKFRKLIKAMAVGACEINVGVLSLFRKDFWKDFI